MKIIFTGLPFFGKKLVAELTKFDKANQYIFCDTYYSRSDRFKFLYHLISADRVVSINGVSTQSGSLDWVIRLKKKLILQWQGTDVLTAINNNKNNALNRKYIDYGSSFTDAEWLCDELKSLNINSSLLHFKHVDPTNTTKAFTSLDAISYIAEGKEKFYGIDRLILLAVAFPKIKFHIIGTKGKELTVPENIIFYGWVDKGKVEQLMNEHPVFIRLTEHDGYALSVMEAIANGNYVLWNHPHPCVSCARDEQEIVTVFTMIQDQLKNTNGARRTDHINWTKANLNKENVLRNFIAVITMN